MEVGDVVVSVDGPYRTTHVLTCGSGMYTHAICVSVDPFILVSEHGDMRWDYLTRANYVGLCKADRQIVKTAMARLDRDRAFAEKCRRERDTSPTTEKP